MSGFALTSVVDFLSTPRGNWDEGSRVLFLYQDSVLKLEFVIILEAIHTCRYLGSSKQFLGWRHCVAKILANSTTTSQQEPMRTVLLGGPGPAPSCMSHYTNKSRRFTGFNYYCLRLREHYTRHLNRSDVFCFTFLSLFRWQRETGFFPFYLPFVRRYGVKFSWYFPPRKC